MDKKKLLIVDDEKGTLFVLERELGARGYSVITADNGNDALRLAKSEAPDLIILDIWMPETGGIVVAAKLRVDPATKDIPVIFLTCLLPKKEGEEQGRVLDGSVFIAKPYSLKGLLAQIDKLTCPQSCTVEG